MWAIFVIAVLLAVGAAVWTGWLWQTSGVSGATTLTTERNDTITVVFVNRSNLSTLSKLDAPSETHDSATGLFRWEGTGAEYNYTIYLATDRRRAQIMQICSHEMDHYWYHQEQPDLSIEEQHRLIEDKYRISVLGWEREDEAFWKWRRECLQIVPHL